MSDNKVEWKLIRHKFQNSELNYNEITNGKISLIAKDSKVDALERVVRVLNDSGVTLYQDDWIEFENKMLKADNRRLKNIIEHGDDSGD